MATTVQISPPGRGSRRGVYPCRRSPHDRWSSHVRVRSKVPDPRAARAGGRFDRGRLVPALAPCACAGAFLVSGPRSPVVVHRPVVTRQTRGGPVPTQAKAAVIDEITERFQKSSAAVLTEYRGLTVAQLTQLRRSLGAGSSYA